MGEQSRSASLSMFESPSNVNNNGDHLPRTLLSAPLRPDLAGLLSYQDRRIYDIQKAKWEVE